MVLITLLLGLTALVLFVRWHILDRYSYFRRRQIAHLPPKFPSGNMNGVATRIHLANWVYDHYMLFRGRDKLFGYYFGTAATIMITDMDLANDILTRDFKTFPSAHSECSDPLSANLFTMEGEQWRTIRTKLSPVFSAMSTRSVLTSLRTVTADLVNYVDQFANNDVGDGQATAAARPINVRDLFMRYINDAMSASIFGLDTGSLRDERHPLMKIGERVFETRNSKELLFYFFIVSYSRIVKLLPIRVFPPEISNYFIGIMDEEMRARTTTAAAGGDDATKNDLLDLLMRIERAGCLTDDETGEVLGKITHNQLLGHAFLTFVLGFITSRVALNFGLYELASNPEIQERLREDIMATIPDGQDVSYDALESMPYLQQVVDETLRRYAPAPWVERKTKMDYKVRNSHHVIEKRTRIVIPIIGFHNDPDIYKDPSRFDPNRMTAEKIKRRHACAFMPWGYGPRGCMAQRLGYLFVKLGIVLLLRRFRFSVNEGTVQPIKMAPSSADMMPSTGIWLNVERISANGGGGGHQEQQPGPRADGVE